MAELEKHFNTSESEATQKANEELQKARERLEVHIQTIGEISVYACVAGIFHVLQVYYSLHCRYIIPCIPGILFLVLQVY